MIDSSHIDERDSVPVIVVGEIYGPGKEEEEWEEIPPSKFEKEEPEE